MLKAAKEVKAVKVAKRKCWVRPRSLQLHSAKTKAVPNENSSVYFTLKEKILSIKNANQAAIFDFGQLG